MLTASANSVDEGASVDVSLTDGMANTDYAYTITGVDPADISIPLTGTFTTDANGAFTGSIAAIADNLTEGTETMKVSIDGTNLSTDIAINDTSVTPVMTFTASAASVDEGNSVDFVIADGMPNTDYAYQITGVDAADIDVPLVQVITTDANGNATLTVTAAADRTTEGSETLSVNLVGTNLGASVDINDTSLDNVAPVADAATANADEAGPIVTGTLTATDPDDTPTFAASGTAVDGVTINSDGSYSFDPSQNAAAQALVYSDQPLVLSQEFTVTDALGATSTSTLTITVAPTPLTATLTPSNGTINEGQVNTFTVTTSEAVTSNETVTFQLAPGDGAAANQGTGNTNLNDFAVGSFNQQTATITTGGTTAAFNVTGLVDNITELPETYNASATVAGNTVSSSAVLQDNNVAGSQGNTITLTTGTDVINPNTPAPNNTGNGDDVIIGNVITVAGVAPNDTPTFNGVDSIDGGLGLDTLRIADAGDDGNGFILAITPTVTGVERLEITNADAGNVVANVSDNFAGLQSISIDNRVVSAIDVDTKANATSVTVKATGASAVDVKDNATTDTLKSVSVEGTSGAIAVESGVLTELGLTKTSGPVTVTAAAGTRTLEATLNGVTGGVITDAEATSLKVIASGAASTGTTLNANKATSIEFSGDQKVSTALIPTLVLNTITSSNTAGVTITSPLANGVMFTGGTGADAITVGATTKAQSMGDGNDTVTLAAGNTAFGAGGTVDGGAGMMDVFAFADSANAATASLTGTFENTISGFEVIQLAASAGNEAINLANLDDINYVKTAGGAGGAQTINNFQNNGTVEILGTAATVNAGGITATIAGAAATQDTFNINLNNSSAGAVNFGSVAVADVETVKITTNDTGIGALNAATKDTLALTAAAATTITVSGNNGLNLTGNGALVTTFDASGVKADGGAEDTAANLGVSFTSANNTAGASVAITGGAGDDVLIGAGANDTILGGDGNDNINGGAGNDVINGGAGNDTLADGNGEDVVVGGDGNDILNIDNDGVKDVFAGLAGNDVITINDGGNDELDEVHFRSVDGTDTVNNIVLNSPFAATNDFIAFLDNGTAGGTGSVNFAAGDTQAGSFGTRFVASDEGTDAGKSYVEFNDLASLAATQALTDQSKKVIVINDAADQTANIATFTASGLTDAYIVVTDGSGVDIYFDSDWGTSGDRTQIAEVDAVPIVGLDVTDFGVYATVNGGVSI